MKIFHFCQSVEKNSGGLRSALFGLNNQLSKHNIDTKIFTFISRKQSKVKELDINIEYLNLNFIFNIHKLLKNIRIFLRNFSDPENSVIHIHGIWMPLPLLGYLLANYFCIPYIISPHGMLMPNAIKDKKFKKQIAMFLFQKRMLDRANLILVSSYLEYKALKNIETKYVVKIIPHAIDFNFNLSNHKLNNIKRKMLFMGRIHPSKGIKELLDIWKTIELNDWKLLVAGIIEDTNFYRNLINSSKKEIKEKRIEFLGPVYGAEKIKLFELSNVFILPTKTENFGLVILEALSFGIPVITTREAPWEIIHNEKIGWWVPNKKIKIKNAILQASKLSNKELYLMGDKARNISMKNFSWANTIKEYIKTYLHLLEN